MKNFIDHDFQPLKRFDSPNGRVYQTPSGKAYPSVTSVTGLLGKDAILAWRKRVGEEKANAISARASSRGTKIHSYCESYLLNEEFQVDHFDRHSLSS